MFIIQLKQMDVQSIWKEQQQPKGRFVSGKKQTKQANVFVAT